MSSSNETFIFEPFSLYVSCMLVYLLVLLECWIMYFIQNLGVKIDISFGHNSNILQL